MGTEEHDRVWREISRIGTCVMITQDRGTLRARPMVGTADRRSRTIWFVGKRPRREEEEIIADPRVCLAYIDPESDTCVSVSGRAAVLDDREKLRELWTASFDASFERGPDDPKALLIAVSPETGECWDAPGSGLAAAPGMPTGFGGEMERASGQNGKVLT